MKISSILLGLLTGRRSHPPETQRAFWSADPYAHPVIRAMSERERADLPPTHAPSGYCPG